MKSTEGRGRFVTNVLTRFLRYNGMNEKELLILCCQIVTIHALMQ